MITTVEDAHTAGYDLYCYTNPVTRAADRLKFEHEGFDCIDFSVTMCKQEFSVLYLGTRRLNRPTRKERGCLC
jgi:hypothetical protein